MKKRSPSKGDEREALLRKFDEELEALQTGVTEFWKTRDHLSVHDADALAIAMAEQIARLTHLIGTMLASESKPKPGSRRSRPCRC